LNTETHNNQVVWHTVTENAATQQLSVDQKSGLPSELAKQRLVEFGHNILQEKKSRSVWLLLYDQFKDFMIIILLIAAIISGFIGELLDTLAILVIVALNAVVGAIQEYRAERAISALKAIATPNVSVLRDGERKTISTNLLVPGDIIFLETGNIVPADLRLLETVNLEINESALTGESVVNNKSSSAITDNNLPLGDRANMAYKGTQVSRGHAKALVVNTGMSTEIGNIASMLQKAVDTKTPLQKRLADFGKRLALAVIGICIIIFITGLLQGISWVLMLLTAISLAVAAIPEALPAVVSVSLALGARKMSKQQALIRHLPAVETLGSVTYICSDKTGTLTQNRMSVDRLFADNRLLESISDDHSYLWQQIGQALAISNDAVISDGVIEGDPTEVALYESAKKAGFNKEDIESHYPRIAELPFDSDRKRMSTIHQLDNGIVVYVKGSPEQILEICEYEIRDTDTQPINREKILDQAEKLASQGYRVMAIALKQLDTMPPSIDQENIEQELSFLALLALIDPPRPEVPNAIKECLSAGIHPTMITGDHPATALAIAQRLGIDTKGSKILTGDQLEKLTDKELDQLVNEINIYARVTPAQKIRIVESLQNGGEFCAMTGDGINDAPALKRADIGVAMGQKGTDVARESADMVLLDDNFATIVNAVHEGRRIFDNIRKFIKYVMTGNSGEIWTLLLAPFLGLPVPLLPIHILWINLVTDGLPGLALAVEPAERGIMQRPPRPPNESIFAHGMWQHILWVGLLIGGVSLFSQAWAIHLSSAHWQTMVFTVLTFAQLVHVMAIRSDKESLLTLGLLSNKPLLGAVVITVALQLCVIYIPFLNGIFRTAPLDIPELVTCFLLSSIILFGVEIEKWFARKGLIYQ
jgi:Ca2+-transporting ATPase